MVWDWVWIGREIEPQQKICFNPRQAKSFLAAAARSAAAAALLLAVAVWRAVAKFPLFQLPNLPLKIDGHNDCVRSSF